MRRTTASFSSLQSFSESEIGRSAPYAEADTDVTASAAT
jgi:hypothetical protein